MHIGTRLKQKISQAVQTSMQIEGYKLGIKPGDRMTFTLMPDFTVVMRVKNKKISELAGMLHKKRPQARTSSGALTLMLGIDTNALVRFLVQDDAEQFDEALKLSKREGAAGRRVFINQLVLMETEWVLRSRYAATKENHCSYFRPARSR
jgi:hypothetical protein